MTFYIKTADRIQLNALYYIQIYDVSLQPKPKWSPGYKISKYKRYDWNYVIVIIGLQKLSDPNIIRDIVKFIFFKLEDNV